MGKGGDENCETEVSLLHPNSFVFEEVSFVQHSPSIDNDWLLRERFEDFRYSPELVPASHQNSRFNSGQNLAKRITKVHALIAQHLSCLIVGSRIVSLDGRSSRTQLINDAKGRGLPHVARVRTKRQSQDCNRHILQSGQVLVE